MTNCSATQKKKTRRHILTAACVAACGLMVTTGVRADYGDDIRPPKVQLKEAERSRAFAWRRLNAARFASPGKTLVTRAGSGPFFSSSPQTPSSSGRTRWRGSC